jgi:hypothetical protein
MHNVISFQRLWGWGEGEAFEIDTTSKRESPLKFTCCFTAVFTIEPAGDSV